MDDFQVIKKPVITERTTVLKEERKVVFKVDVRANKREVKRAVESLFDTHVEKVNIINMKGKPKRMGVHAGRRPDWKKAIVKLKEDAKQDLFGD